MARSCKYHTQYLFEGDIACSEMGVVSAATCSGCKLFTLRTEKRPQRKRSIVEDMPAAKRPCRWLGSKRKCCADMYICRQSPDTNCILTGTSPGLRTCGSCEFYSPTNHPAYEAMRLAEAPQPDPFKSTPSLHFGGHLWPVKRRWKWHADKWNELAEKITGRCIVFVAVDESTDSFEEVRSVFSDRIELIARNNNDGGENDSFRALQTMIPTGENDVLLYAHGKGVRQHTYDSYAVRLWTEIMYETVLFNHDAIINKMAAGYKMFGSFRAFGDEPLNPTHQWHYSGTYFSVRAKHLAGKIVKAGYGGVEAWPGDHFKPHECWCEFGENTYVLGQYQLASWYPDRVDAQMQWESDRLSGPRCEQHQRELDWFATHLRNTDRILVIGSKHGGLEYQIRKRFPSVRMTSIDIAPAPDNAESCIVGDSKSVEVRTIAESAGPFDAVFVDGDHSLAGVHADWEWCKTLAPRLIAFHDIADAVKHKNEGCQVDRLWAELKTSTLKTQEMIVGCGWGGIGIVFPQETAKVGFGISGDDCPPDL